ncbi:integrase, partial [Cognatishimia sp. F0-27]|nr:integrase [Cognatishimia sp. F0-27]
FFAKGFPEAEVALRAWITHLEDVALYGPDDPLFPATALKVSAETGFQADGFARRPWKSTEPARKIVNAAFTAAGLATFGPHAFRHMLARHATKNCTSVAEIVATSQNLGHTDVLTTLRSYGQIDRDRVRELITGESAYDVSEE